MKRVRYWLEVGDLAPAKMEYSYGRRSQAVTHTTRWRQVAVAEDAAALRELWEAMHRRQSWERGRICANHPGAEVEYLHAHGADRPESGQREA